jgi:hypothetical protein
MEDPAMSPSLQDAVTVDNPAEILRNQNGIFEIVSPYGLVFHVTCQPGTTMKMREVGHPPRSAEPFTMAWRIRKISSGIFV